jgi:uncharacterized protein (TIGR00369 family)
VSVQPADQRRNGHVDGHAVVDGRQRTYSWEDPSAAAAAARELTGSEFFAEMLARRLPMPPIAETLAFIATSVADGVARFEIEPREFHYNPIGSVHGGVIATLCDSACGCAVHSLLPAGSYYASLDLSVKFLRPVSAASGILVCEGKVLHFGGRSALAEATLTGADGKLYAHATSSCMIFRPATP